MRSRIEAWLARYRLRVTGTIAVQEFRNRVLRDTYYLLTKLNQFGSYQQTLDYIFNVLPRQLDRKRRICVMILHNLLPGASDEELTERARLYCRALLVYGENRFLQGVDSLGPGVGCYWAQIPVKEKRRYRRYEFADNRCSRAEGRCRIGGALRDREELRRRILDFVEGLPPERMTTELERARAFLRRIGNDRALDRVSEEEPCLKVGDLLLALESVQVPEVYTMNYGESQAYCDVLGQNLTVRPNNPEKNEVQHLQAAKPWPTPK